LIATSLALATVSLVALAVSSTSRATLALVASPKALDACAVEAAVSVAEATVCVAVWMTVSTAVFTAACAFAVFGAAPLSAATDVAAVVGGSLAAPRAFEPSWAASLRRGLVVAASVVPAPATAVFVAWSRFDGVPAGALPTDTAPAGAG
jgi:hypothetical protein